MNVHMWIGTTHIFKYAHCTHVWIHACLCIQCMSIHGRAYSNLCLCAHAWLHAPAFAHMLAGYCGAAGSVSSKSGACLLPGAPLADLVKRSWARLEPWLERWRKQAWTSVDLAQPQSKVAQSCALTCQEVLFRPRPLCPCEGAKVLSRSNPCPARRWHRHHLLLHGPEHIDPSVQGGDPGPEPGHGRGGLGRRR